MYGFSDETYIDISSGSGGNGCVSFRREKFIEKGGPDGGDGGKGGDLVFVVKSNMKTLSRLKARRVFRAEKGQDGRGARCYGRNGVDMEVEVPPGTVIKDAETGDVIKDLTGLDRFVFLKGGKGGLGNYHFRTATRQAPRFAQPGEAGQEMRIGVELLIIADIGFVGFPNAGKSSLLNLLTNARGKVADYPFTTKIPQLGMLRYKGQDVVLADIPGIIEGASQGLGMGYKFLRHISRTKGLAYFIDLTEENYLEAYDKLHKELEDYSEELVNKNECIIGTKLDEPDTADKLKELKKKYPDKKVIGLSIYSEEGMKEVEKTFFHFAYGERKIDDGFKNSIDNEAIYSDKPWTDSEN